jgi:imidazolonepropionase-like amidohydrolase
MSTSRFRCPLKWPSPLSMRSAAHLGPVAGVALTALVAASCTRSNVDEFLSRTAPVLALTNVRVIDGTGTPAKENQTIVIRDGRIDALGLAANIPVPPDAQQLGLQGRTVIPGLVGMHDHLFYHVDGAGNVATAPESFAMLYLAAGVTTIRTAGAVDLDADLQLKRLIDEGKRPGPSIHVTSPYLHATTPAPDPERVARDVAAWADRGVTSFKAYESLRREELKAAIETAHARGLKVTGHLCAVSFHEAAELGIDNLEHGLLADSGVTPGRQPDVCPDASERLGAVLGLDAGDPPLQRLISTLVRRGVAITSTLAAFETFASRAQLDPRTLLVLAPSVQDSYRAEQAKLTDENRGARSWNQLLRKEMEFERAFLEAGGRLVAGNDPTGWGGIVAGFGNQRQVELLVDAGLTPEMAIRVASANGAALLNDSTVGYLAPGLQADLVVVQGNPAKNIADIRNVEVVFKKGVGFDPKTLIAAASGTVGARDYLRVLRWPYGPMILGVLVILVARRFLRGRRTTSGLENK